LEGSSVASKRQQERGEGRTLELLFSSTTTAEGAQSSYKLLKINGASSTIEDPPINRGPDMATGVKRTLRQK
jgi:hypothetical protein